MALADPRTVRSAVPPAALCPPEPATEKEFQASVIEEAKANGFRVYHTHDSRRSEKGFMDLVIAKPGRVLVSELKIGGNTPAVDQAWWLGVFQSVGIPAHLWYPRDMDRIRQILRV